MKAMAAATQLQDWWIVEADDVERTACPGRVFAYQAAEVIRGMRRKVNTVRPVNPADVGDRLAVVTAEKELQEHAIEAARRSGALQDSRRGSRLIVT